MEEDETVCSVTGMAEAFRISKQAVAKANRVNLVKLIRINKDEKFSNKKGNHINGIELFWSFTKRRLAKFNGVKINFDLYLKECEWRWNKIPLVLEKELSAFINKYYSHL